MNNNAIETKADIMPINAANETIKTKEDFRCLIPPLQAEELQQLETSILSEGCREAIILWDSYIVDGHNRYSICTKHGIPFKTVSRDFESEEHAKLWMIRNQLGRRNLDKVDRSRLALKLKPIVKAVAENNMSAGGKIGAEITNRGSQNSVNPVDNIDTQKELAKLAEVSHDTISRVEYIDNHADKETLEKFNKRDLSINQAYQLTRHKEKEKERESHRQENREKIKQVDSPKHIIGTATFSTIVIDPPWDWGDEGDKDQLGRARPDYSTMSIQEITSLPVSDLADDNCHIYLWITNRSLPKGFSLLEAWGFRYITCLTWVKPNFGMGNYFRGQTEQVLFGVKGSMPLKRKDQGTVFNAPRGNGGHSSKPAEFYQIVESCSPGPYLEMFSRSNRNDWTHWGEYSYAA